MPRAFRALTVVAILAMTCSVAAQFDARPARKLYPMDESSIDPSFTAFKSSLLAAAERGDIVSLRAAMVPVLIVSFEEDTADHFVKMNLKAGKPWRELRDALLLGVAEDRDIDGKPLFVAPYVSQPENGVDVHGELVVTGENVNVRQAPDPRAAVIDRLSHDIVRAGPDNRFGSLQENDTPGKPSAWAQIITPAGKLGYVYGQFVRGPTNIRFHFKRIDGRWRIVYISAGD